MVHMVCLCKPMIDLLIKHMWLESMSMSKRRFQCCTVILVVYTSSDASQVHLVVP